MKSVSLERLDYKSVSSIFGLIEENIVHCDLTSLTFATPDGTIPFLLLLKKIQQNNGAMLKLSLPDFSEANHCPLSYLGRIGFFDKLGPTVLYDKSDRFKLQKLQVHFRPSPSKHRTPSLPPTLGNQSIRRRKSSS